MILMISKTDNDDGNDNINYRLLSQLIISTRTSRNCLIFLLFEYECFNTDFWVTYAKQKVFGNEQLTV